MAKKKTSSKKKEEVSTEQDAVQAVEPGTEVAVAGTETINVEDSEMKDMVNQVMNDPANAENGISDKIREEQLMALINKKQEVMTGQKMATAGPGGPGGNVKMAQASTFVPGLQSRIKVPTKLEIRADDMGYGVYATEDVEDGEIIEEAPMSVLAFRVKDGQTDPKVSSLLRLSIPMQCSCEECVEKGLPLTMSSGYVHIYNHAIEPNARILQHKSNKRIFTVEALRNIKAGEQIFINYGQNYPEQWLNPEMSGAKASENNA